MAPTDLRTNTEKLADAVASHDLEKLRAADTVRNRVSDPAAQQELLACLGLLEPAV